ncbi:CHAT domain-containing protein [Mucilaginibacter sabulilitoris]|uniref:CHAT domain-containing protein n=1 Tax=Mucilaginibacter sabulilitoris TaxID=1173583 RepID=A0ABZ0TH52_9SPHI|nr:CHAT domain-containing protein [Mucilaginibacter sabulilitoris]WPU91563.1 CHAT domain-containing protein [Mucilaginibacter sabulilitoris]
MYSGRFILCMLFVWLFFRPAANAFQQSPNEYKRLFSYAEKLAAADNPTDKTDQQALTLYKRVIAILSQTNADAPYLFKTYVSTGAFLQVLNRSGEAIDYFQKSFILKKKLSALPDSVLFKPLLYCGNSYYQQDNPDSAAILYNQAKNIAEKFPTVSGIERLYNTLGVVAYSTGNYNKSIPYYEKAISMLQSQSSYETALLVTYKSNLASAYRRLKRYDEALKLYKGALSYHIETDKLLHNIGAVYLAMVQPAQAIDYLKSVKYEDKKKLNDLGKAYLQQNNYMAALGYLEKAQALNNKASKAHKNSDYGITLKYTGDAWVQQQQLIKGLDYYQRAIQNLLLDFRDYNIYTNPQNFNSVFNADELLETLLAKASAFKLLYAQNHNIKDLDASLQTFLCFYKLADHIERFYENDEARYLISSRKYAAHQLPIDICLQLYNLTHQKKYIEQAYFLDEENKASTLSLYLEESKLKTSSGVSQSLLHQEAVLKENITRISLQASGETDSLILNKLRYRINDYTIKLLAIQQKINQQTGFSQLTVQGNGINISLLQKNIPAQSAILSYHVGQVNILCFVITHNGFDFFTRPLTSNFMSVLKDFFREAQYREGNNNSKIRELGKNLYGQLIKPAEIFLAGKDALMIIPDDELNYLPFELLANDEGTNLLRKYSITYNYSCGILQNSNVNLANSQPGKLGIAPFNKRVNSLDMETPDWALLPASKQEIESMGGTSLFNEKATKQQFLNSAHQYGIIHLATHAYVNDLNPGKSYIAFYPAAPASGITYKLYQPEIYNLKLDKTALVILSACESGTGELIKGEGLMSLSRAFSYAGCNNIITSMWKADDASTAYISARLHAYLKKGHTITQALKEARLDYLNDDQIPSAKKASGYWAHLRLIGGFEKTEEHHYLFVWLLIIVVFCVILFIKRNLDRLKQPRLNQ